MSTASRNKVADTLTVVYGNRSFASSTITSLVQANILQGDPQGGIVLQAPAINSSRSLRDFLTNTFPARYDAYPDPKGGLLRVSVLHKRPDPVHSPDPRMDRTHKGVDLDDLHANPTDFIKGFEGVWDISDENADLAVKQGTHLMASLRGYTHPSMVRKIKGYSRINGYVWFHTDGPDARVRKWFGTGVILPRDNSTGVWGWAVPPVVKSKQP